MTGSAFPRHPHRLCTVESVPVRRLGSLVLTPLTPVLPELTRPRRLLSPAWVLPQVSAVLLTPPRVVESRLRAVREVVQVVMGESTGAVASVMVSVVSATT